MPVYTAFDLPCVKQAIHIKLCLNSPPPTFLYPEVLQLYHIGSLHLPEDPVRAAVI